MPTDVNSTAVVQQGTATSQPSILFPRLPVLETVIAELSKGAPSFKGIGLICVQHMLETTGSLLEALLKCGLEPENMFVLGKLYSNCPDVQSKLRSLRVNVVESRSPNCWGKYHEHLKLEAAELWRQATPLVYSGALKQVVVLDDGGHAIASMPVSFLERVRIIGIEQTMSGTFGEQFERRPVPVIDVASSAAKQLVEAPLIAAAIIEKLKTRVPMLDRSKVYGVVGWEI